MGITIDEAIKRYNDNAEYERTHGSLQGCLDFKQLAEWLKELKQLRERTSWIPVTERPPDDPDRYLTTIYNDYGTGLRYIMVSSYFLNGDWCPDDECASNNVIAWMPLPEPYKAESEEPHEENE